MEAAQPWLQGFSAPLYLQVFEALVREQNTGQSVIELINAQLAGQCNAYDKTLRCVPHAELPAGVAYETYIFETGCIPTRAVTSDSAISNTTYKSAASKNTHNKGAMHDACNALMWVQYPQTKAALNALQANAIAHQAVGEKASGQRGAARDALTLFDESALIVCTDDVQAAKHDLLKRQWKTLLHQRRGAWGTSIVPHLFGHGLLQKLQQPYPAITAQVWCISHAEPSRMTAKEVDTLVAKSVMRSYEAGELSPKAMLPLPVLGIPSWWADNCQASFYDNVQVFRPLS